MTRAVLLYGLVTIAVVVATGLLLVALFPVPGSVEAVRLSAAVAALVQIGAFVGTRLMAPRNVMAAWGVGSLVRILALLVYSLLAVKVLGLAPAPALLSLALFFFLATLLEPLFLRR